MTEKATIDIEGMNCNHCVNAVKNLIEEVEGVQSVTVDLTTKQAEVAFEPNATDAHAIIENINSSNNYKATQK